MNYENIEILFVEDSVDDAILTIRAFAKSGLRHKLLHVKDGVAALDFIYCRGEFSGRSNIEFPKLILLDLKMPKVSGMQVLKQVKSDPIYKSIPVVMLTSSSEEPDVEECFALGANSYIVKPVDSDNFTKAVKEIGLYWMMLSQPPHL